MLPLLVPLFSCCSSRVVCFLGVNIPFALMFLLLCCSFHVTPPCCNFHVVAPMLHLLCCPSCVVALTLLFSCYSFRVAISIIQLLHCSSQITLLELQCTALCTLPFSSYNAQHCSSCAITFSP
jgi:hypothetical protein